MADALFDFDAIHAEFRPKLLRYLNGLVGPNEAEDVCQDVLVRVHAGRKGFRGEASLSTWIYRIATNAAIDRLRTRSFGEIANRDLPSQALDETSADDAMIGLAGDDTEPSAEISSIRREMNDCIKIFVDTLPDSSRAVLVLSDLEGFKNREIAEILDLSVDVVKIRLHRARRELRRRFEVGCDFYRTEANELACDRKSPAGPTV